MIRLSGRFGLLRSACVASAVGGVIAASLLGFAPEASAGSLSGSLYVDPNTQSARWVAANSGDYRAATIRDQIASKPQSVWFTDANPSTIASKVSSYLSTASSTGQTPVIVAYGIYSRDCSGPSGGGATSISQYNQWTSSFVQGLGSRQVIVIVEPDSLALTTCLSSSQLSERYSAISSFVSKIKSANSSAKVYLDAGHSGWNSASETASRLRSAGISQADGFYSNVSNYHYTADEVAFGKNVLSALGNPSGKHQVIDTSRNGNGALGSEWCDPSGRLVGRAPTLNTGESTVDAYLWVKLPGEADGCAGAAGQFIPDLAYQLAGSGRLPSSTTTTTTRPTTTTTRPTTTTTTTRPTTTAGNGGGSGNGSLVTPGGKCLGASGTGNGAAAQIQTCNGGSTQSWSFNSDGTLRTLGGSMCLDATGRGTANGTALVIYSCNGQSNQQFAQGSNSSIVNSGSGRCVDVPNGSTTDGTGVQLYDCWGGDPQKWTSNGSGNPQNPTTTTTTTTSSRPTTTTTLPQRTTTTSNQGGGGGCSASYTLTGSWGGGFQGDVKVTNTGGNISSWTVTVNLNSGQSITSLWSGVASGSTGTVQVRNADYNGNLGSGASTSFGFTGGGNGTPAPTVTCTAG